MSGDESLRTTCFSNLAGTNTWIDSEAVRRTMKFGYNIGQEIVQPSKAVCIEVPRKLFLGRGDGDVSQNV